MRAPPATSSDPHHPRCGYVYLVSRLLVTFCVSALVAAIPSRASTSSATSASMDREVPLARPSWFWSSVPPGRSVSVEYHAVLQWFNPVDPLPTAVDEHDLNPALTKEEGGESQRQVLELRVLPPTGHDDLVPTDWTGIALPLSNFDLDFSKLEAVEIWVNDFRPDHTQTSGNLRFEMGHVSEDAFWDRNNPPNGKLDTEDKNGDGRLDRRDPNDGTYLSEDEDTGLDGVHDEQETGGGDQSDPNGDNYSYTPLWSGFSSINNFEGNALDDPNARPDSEDLNHDAGFDTANDYFEVPIDLSDSEYVITDVPMDYAGDPDVDANNGWRLFRLPVTAVTSVGAPSWAAIQSIRLILENLVEPSSIQIGGIRFVGIPSPVQRPHVTLRQNRPNPFNPTTTIPYEVGEAGQARLDIFDVGGRWIRTLVNGPVGEGVHYVTWNGRDKDERPVAAGIYLYRLRKAEGEESRRMVLLK